jgi:integrase
LLHSKLMDPFRTAMIVALSMLDPALAWILFAWKRALQFGGDRDWVLASPQKAGEFRCESTSLLEKQVEPAAKAAQFGNDVGWHTFRHTYATIAAAIRSGSESSGGTVRPRRHSNNIERAYAGRQ